MELSDPVFDDPLTLRQAYLAMLRFLEEYHRRGETTTGELLGSIQVGLWQDKSSADPAQLNDFLGAVRAVKAASGHRARIGSGARKHRIRGTGAVMKLPHKTSARTRSGFAAA